MAGAHLVLDTATTLLVVAVRSGPGQALVDGTGPADRGAAALGSRLAATLGAAGISLGQLGALGVGTGPGSFTGLRVGMATAKTMAWSLGIAVVGLSTADGLRRAAVRLLGADAADLAVIQAAGARDHYLSLPDATPRLVPPTMDLLRALDGRPALALDVDPDRLIGVPGPRGRDPRQAGRAAAAGLGAALLELLVERLAAGAGDDPALLVPAYVALPRGIVAAPGEPEWVPEFR